VFPAIFVGAYLLFPAKLKQLEQREDQRDGLEDRIRETRNQTGKREKEIDDLENNPEFAGPIIHENSSYTWTNGLISAQDNIPEN